MHIHIATMGQSTEPVTKAINAIPGIDKIHLICSAKYEDSIKTIKNVCVALGISLEISPTSGFDFSNISNEIQRICDMHDSKKDEISINITGGTNLMAAAACSCAYLYGATIYYVLWDDTLSKNEQVIKIPIPNAPNIRKIKGLTKDILCYILEHGDEELNNTEISTKFYDYKQKIGYHIRLLNCENLINVKKKGRENKITITPQGRMVARWLSSKEISEKD